MNNYDRKIAELSKYILKNGLSFRKEEKPNSKKPAWSDITYTVEIKTVRELSEPIEEFLKELRDDIIKQYKKETDE